MNDEEIIRKVLAGDQGAFRELVTAHKNTVYGVIMRQVGDSTLAQELAQDTFVKAYRGLHSFRFEARFSTWLIRIALNVANSHFASRAYKEQQLTETFELTKHDRAGEVVERDNSNLRVSQFRRALGALKPKYREVLVLCGLQGESYEIAAQTLRVPVGTIRSRLHEARRLVKVAFDKGEV